MCLLRCDVGSREVQEDEGLLGLIPLEDSFQITECTSERARVPPMRRTATVDIRVGAAKMGLRNLLRNFFLSILPVFLYYKHNLSARPEVGRSVA